MDDITAIIDSLIEFRDSQDENLRKDYKKAFKKASLFVVKNEEATATEYIPFNLISQFAGTGKKKLKAAFEAQFGKPQEDKDICDDLYYFCELHGLKVPAIKGDGPLLFFSKNTFKARKKIASNSLQKEAVAPKQEKVPPFFNRKKILQYAIYGGTKYQASDEHLRQVGSGISQYIVAPTNHWLQLSCPEGFITEPERYWQVAGNFKDFTWGKILKAVHKDKRVFFAMGVDFEKKALFYRLDCLRSGSAKLSEEYIQKFDYFMADQNISFHIPFTALKDHNWDSISKAMQQFIKEKASLYDAVIDFIWLGQVHFAMPNKLLEVKSAPSVITHPQEEWVDKSKDESAGLALILRYEKTLLRLQGKEELASKVVLRQELIDTSGHYDILSFHSDGSPKHIIAKVTRAHTVHGFDIDIEEIAQSQANSSQTYLYIVHLFERKENSGRLLKKRGDLNKILDLKATHFKATLK